MSHALAFLLTVGYLYCLYQFTRYVVDKLNAAIVRRRQLRTPMNAEEWARNFAKIQALVKALEASGYKNNMSGGPLKIESLEPTLRLITFTAPDWMCTWIRPASLHVLHPGRLMDEMLWATRPHIIEEWDLDHPHIGQDGDEGERRLQQEVWRIEEALSPEGKDKYSSLLMAPSDELTPMDRYNMIKPLADAEGVI